ncbi:MAG: DUF3300 domain-containing protein [Reyranella sp.]|uniref:DUF3300 domain-containing protein n=1 Tax=Reyranella sp. TaxID=1929291 RepID=UPI001AD0A779|nr:DUF3300 domain-containing protein [Reyranella sp.]MBN9085298.1 DUF3300 domain-containing protein [Reyranella sp.]
MQRRIFIAGSFLLYALGVARNSYAQGDSKNFKPEELDQLLAPIALYPDSLLSQILMASGYPLEVVEAARWSKANPNLKGDAAVNAVKDKDWDTSIKSLVAFPDVLKQLNEHLDWTQKLGDAMIGQESDVADSIQRLRAKASAAGNLQSTPQQAVTTQGSGDTIQYIIQPTNPQVVYVPQYNPGWAYGPWPYPAYPPVYYPFGAALATGFFWGLGIAAGAALIGGWNWGGRGQSYANINVNRAVNIDNNFNRNRPDRPDRPDRPGAGGGERWQHQPEHRKGVAYRDPATRQRFNQAQRPGAAQRDQFRGRLDGGPGGSRPGGGGGQGIANRPGGGQGIGNRPGGGQVNRPQQRPNALGGVNRGQQINREGARGRQQMNRAQSHPNYNRGGGGHLGGGGARGGGGRR